MATQLQRTRVGLKLAMDVSKRPVPRPRGTYPLPNIPVPQANLLTVALETVAETGRKGIRVTSNGGLPGAESATWELLHFAFQTGPVKTVWEPMPVRGPFSILFDQAMPSATHLFTLRKTEGGQATYFPVVSIVTPSDDTLGNLNLLIQKFADAESDDALTEMEKVLYRITWDQIAQEYPSLYSEALRVGPLDERAPWVAAYSALDAVKSVWIEVGTTDITNINPKPAARFSTYFSARQALVDRIEEGRKQDLDLALGPSAMGDGVTTQFLAGAPKRTNLLKYSRDFSNAVWTKYAAGAATLPVVTAAAGLAPDGTMTAQRITFNRGGSASGDICTVSQTVTGQTIGNPFAPSIWLVSNTGANQQVMIYWSGLATGKGGGTITNVVTVTPQWQRFSCPDLAAASSLAIQIGCRVAYGDQILDILAWESQLEPGDAVTENITTGASAVSDYGISCEDWRGTWKLSPASRTNVVKYCRDFTQSAWVKRGTAAVAGNSLPSPDGNTGDGDTISGLGAIFTNDIYQSCTGVTGSRYEPSFWLYKISTSGTLRIQNTQGGSGRWDIDLAALPNGWTKMVRGHAALTVVQEFVCSAGSIGPHLVSPNGPISFGIWQMQMEPGNVATPEIATFAAAVTQTDYTVASGLATLSPAPWKGGIVRGVSSNAASVAAGAATIIANASLDTKITNLERPALRNLRASLAASVTSAKAKADAMAPAVAHAALDTAWTAFTTNVDPILAATTDSTVVKATFDGWWSAVYSAVTDLQGVMARQAEATANTALAATVAAGSDGVLSRGEKPGVIIDFTGATADHTMLLAKAQACGVAYSDFTEAYSALRDYMESLSPSYTSTTTDTPINATTWADRWNAWGAAYTDMLVRIASAAPSTVDGIGTTNQNLTINAAAPVVDGVTMVAGKVVMLAGQTTKIQNGVHQVAYAPPAGAAYNVFPAASSNSSLGGSLTNPALGYDATSSVPNDATYALLSSGTEDNNYGEVVYSGFTGSNLTGDITIKIAPTCDQGTEIGEASVAVYVSTNGGQSYTLARRFTGTAAMTTVTFAVSGVSGANIRVKIRASTNPDFGFNQNHEWVQVGVLASSANIHSVYLAVPVSGSANWSFVRLASIPNASVWRSRAGTTFGPGIHYLATVAADSGVTLTTQESPYEDPMGKPASGSAFLKRDSNGGNTWEARRFGFPDYANGASRALTTVYQASADGWLCVVADGDYMNEIRIFVGATNNPTTLIYYAGDNINSYTKQWSAMIPIPSGTYYKITSTPSPFERITMTFFPSLT